MDLYRGKFSKQLVFIEVSEPELERVIAFRIRKARKDPEAREVERKLGQKPPVKHADERLLVCPDLSDDLVAQQHCDDGRNGRCRFTRYHDCSDQSLYFISLPCVAQ